jgi:methionine-rich copper-binding protein CopC
VLVNNNNNTEEWTMAKNYIVAAVILSICAIGSEASASPRMISATPGAQSVVSAPTSVRILFSEPVAPTATGAAIASDKGQAVTTGKPQLNGTNPRQIVVPITGAMDPGTYTVAWFAVGRDAARVTGTFQFQVK